MNLVFKHRHPGPELMDNPNVDAQALTLNLKELERINTTLGGYNTTFYGLRQLELEQGKSYTLLDVGCGGGDTVAAVYNWGKKRNINFTITGLDQSETAISFAKKRCADIPDVRFETTSFQTFATRSETFDIIMCSLFTHHLYGEDLKILLQLMDSKSRVGFVINDLQRHKIAWLSISMLTALFSQSHLVKHDAPLSVKRGFTMPEWHGILQASGISGAGIKSIWAFRHAIYKRHAV